MTPQQHAEHKPVKTAPSGEAFHQAQPGGRRKTGRGPVADDELLAPQALLQAVIDAVPEHIIVVDRAFRVVLANRIARAEAATDPVSQGLTCHRLMHGRDIPCGESVVCCPVEQVIQTKKPTTVTHTRRDARDTEIISEVTATPILDSYGEVARVVLASRDITQRERADEERAELEARLHQAQKAEAIGRLAGRIAHEFNNILTAILGNVELMTSELEAERPPDDPLLTGLAHIDHVGRRAVTLTQQLLALSRRQVAKPQLLDPNQVVRDMEELLRSLLDERTVFDLSLGPGLQSIYADLVQIEQIIMSLVLNAREAMPAGGKLTLTTANVVFDEAYVSAHRGAHAGPHVMIAVSDTGCGMDEETRKVVIEPFFTAKRQEQQSGLGLSAVCSVIQQAGGYITVDSEIDRGTTFRVYLPVGGNSARNAS
jgi:two-component system cell cycle sensor histidine kinase/response regulator CckA